jgi:hypothetical protein
MYKKSKLTGNIYTDSLELVPMDDREQSYKDWLAWKKNGGIEIEIDNTPDELIQYEINNCPQIITRRQMLKQLFIDGFDFDQIKAMITDPLTLIDLNESTIFERQNENVIAIGTALGIDLNTFFTNASLL